MAYLLFIETSTKTCSVAIAKNKDCLVEKTIPNTQSHAKELPILIKNACKEVNLQLKQLEAIVVSGGPGSYTGLRIGMSTAKGLAYSLDIPMIMVDTLIALGKRMAIQQKDEKGLYWATMDSRKGEIYYALIDNDLKLIEKSKPAKINELNFVKYEKMTIYMAGNTLNKLKNCKFEFPFTQLDVAYSAKNLILIGNEKFENKAFTDIVYSEPNYLKPFQ